MKFRNDEPTTRFEEPVFEDIRERIKSLENEPERWTSGTVDEFMRFVEKCMKS